MRSPEEIARLHGERIAARAAVNNTPFRDQIMNDTETCSYTEDDYFYETVVSGRGFDVMKCTRKLVASSPSLEDARRIVTALEQFEGI